MAYDTWLQPHQCKRMFKVAKELCERWYGAWEVNNRQLCSTYPALSVQQARSHVTSIFAEP